MDSERKKIELCKEFIRPHILMIKLCDLEQTLESIGIEKELINKAIHELIRERQ